MGAGRRGETAPDALAPALHRCRSGGNQLAVLHPRKLVVYGVQAAGSSFLQLSQLYEHALEHTAANMTTGGFGGARGARPARRGRKRLRCWWALGPQPWRARHPRLRSQAPAPARPPPAGVDYIAVQSYDGQLSLFEQERFAFARFLPAFLVPGPLCYCAQLDSFLTCNAAFEVESYRCGSQGGQGAGCAAAAPAVVASAGCSQRPAPVQQRCACVWPAGTAR